MESTSTRASTKRSRYEGYEKIDGDPKRQKAEVLARYRTSYRLNRHGSGIFTFYRRSGIAAQVHDEVRRLPF